MICKVVAHLKDWLYSDRVTVNEVYVWYRRTLEDAQCLQREIEQWDFGNPFVVSTALR